MQSKRFSHSVSASTFTIILWGRKVKNYFHFIDEDFEFEYI